jgi:hypothetical protein
MDAHHPGDITGMVGEIITERFPAPGRCRAMCTVQAPQSAIPQPNFVPVIPSTSRNTHNRGVSPSTSTSGRRR